ncbi:MAG: hypothetical protein D6797_06840 [Bdellovibrio sp.]|nr:MAG: hypothetical protein D6797_06840 [Bdellovibrio sp.]
MAFCKDFFILNKDLGYKLLSKEGFMKTILILLSFGWLVSCGSASKKTEKVTPLAPPKVKVKKQTAKEASAKGSQIHFQCQLEKDVRSIEVVVNEKGRCEVLYTKNKETQSKANGVPDSGFCPKVANRIKNNLEKAGFQCR